MTAVTLNAHPYSDDGSEARDMLNGGHQTWLLPMLSDAMVEVGAAAVSASSAAASEAAAAISAAASASVLRGTSTSSVATGTGSKTFTTQAGKHFGVGIPLKAHRTSDPTVTMVGLSAAYDSGTGALTITVATSTGAGTHTDWTISVIGETGAAAVAGAPGIGHRSISSADTVIAADAFRWLHCTNTFTLSLTAGATLGTNFAFFVHNEGTGIITIDPNSSEQIDGANTKPVYPKQSLMVSWDGSKFTVIELNAGTAHTLIVRDQKTSGTSGGNSTSTTVHVRDLQTTALNTMEGASLVSNTVQLANPGTYEFMAVVPGGASNGQRAYIYNDTDGAYELASTNASVGSGTGALVVMGVITITASKTFSVRHYTATGASSGLGSAVSDGRPEIYTVLRIRRLA